MQLELLPLQSYEIQGKISLHFLTTVMAHKTQIAQYRRVYLSIINSLINPLNEIFQCFNDLIHGPSLGPY